MSQYAALITGRVLFPLFFLLSSPVWFCLPVWTNRGHRQHPQPRLCAQIHPGLFLRGEAESTLRPVSLTIDSRVLVSVCVCLSLCICVWSKVELGLKYSWCGDVEVFSLLELKTAFHASLSSGISFWVHATLGDKTIQSTRWIMHSAFCEDHAPSALSPLGIHWKIFKDPIAWNPLPVIEALSGEVILSHESLAVLNGVQDSVRRGKRCKVTNNLLSARGRSLGLNPFRPKCAFWHSWSYNFNWLPGGVGSVSTGFWETTVGGPQTLSRGGGAEEILRYFSFTVVSNIQLYAGNYFDTLTQYTTQQLCII